MKTVNTHQAKTQLSKLIAEVERGEESVVICRNGEPVVELRAIPAAPDPLRTHPVLSKIQFHEDASLPLTEHDWQEANLFPEVS